MEAVSELGPEVGATLLATRSAEDIARLAQEIPSDDAAALIDNLPEDLSAAVLDLMRPKESGVVENLLEYAERTAGRIMNPQVFALAEDLTVGEAITELQQNREVEMVFYLYVVDDRRHLVGVVPLRRWCRSRHRPLIGRLIGRARVDTDQEEWRQVAAYNLLAISVVDEENKLVGSTVDDVIDVIDERPPRTSPAGGRGRRRAFTPAGESPASAAVAGGESRHGLLAAGVVALFEGTIGLFPVLAIFMPIVAGMGGNAGTQTLTGVVRGIALGELTWTNARKALLKEALVGIGNGVVLGLLAALVVWATRGNPVLGVVLGLAMVINMFVAAAAGTLVPLGLRAANIDPALASSVFITTMTDVFGFFSFLGLATLFAQYLPRVS
jgi:magnesium transporter